MTRFKRCEGFSTPCRIPNYKGSELTNKLIKVETKQSEDSNNSEASAFVNPKQLLFTEKDKPDCMYFQFNNDTSIADEKEEIKNMNLLIIIIIPLLSPSNTMINIILA